MLCSLKIWMKHSLKFILIIGEFKFNYLSFWMVAKANLQNLKISSRQILYWNCKMYPIDHTHFTVILQVLALSDQWKKMKFNFDLLGRIWQWLTDLLFFFEMFSRWEPKISYSKNGNCYHHIRIGLMQSSQHFYFDSRKVCFQFLKTEFWLSSDLQKGVRKFNYRMGLSLSEIQITLKRSWY